MFLAPDDAELAVADAAAAFARDAMPITRLHGGNASPDADPALRERAAEDGWFGLLLPESEDGSGLSSVEHALFFREVGRCCGPLDLLAQTLAVLTADDDAALRDELRTGLRGVALAAPDGDSLRLLGARDATLVLVVEPEGALLLDVADVATEERPSLDPATSMRVIVSGTPRTVAAAADEVVWSLGELGVAAQLVGIAEAALDRTVAYAKIRETFGRKIGTYQAVRHACADMALRAEAARCQLWSAAAALKEGREHAPVHLDAAKHLANRAAVANADACIQLHGGIGVTDEHDAHVLLKHALLLSRLFGAKRELLGRLLHAELEA